MNKLEELSKRMDRIKDLMDATHLNIEELLAYSAEKLVKCEKCPILKECDEHCDYGCYTTWLKFLGEGRIE